MADASSPDTKEAPLTQSTGITRRSFLKKAALVGAATVVGSLGAPAATAVMNLGKTPSSETEDPQVNPNDAPQEVQNPTIVETSEPKKDELDLFLENNPLLINLTPQERKTMKIWVQKGIEDYSRKKRDVEYASVGDIPIPEDVKHRAKNSIYWQSHIDRVAEQIGVRPNSFARSILTGVIFVESEGDPENLCQLDPSVVKDFAKKLGITFEQAQKMIQDPQTNIRVALEYIDRLKDLFFDPTMIMWAFNDGEGNVTNAIHTKITEDKSEDEIREINRRFKELLEPATFYYVKSKHFNIINVLQSKAVQEGLIADLRKSGRNVMTDESQYYVAKILAGSYLISQMVNQTKV